MDRDIYTAFRFASLATTIVTMTIKINITNPPQIPAEANKAANPFSELYASKQKRVEIFHPRVSSLYKDLYIETGIKSI